MAVNPKIGGKPPKSSINNKVFHSKPSILGTPIFGSTPISRLMALQALLNSQPSPIKKTEDGRRGTHLREAGVE